MDISPQTCADGLPARAEMLHIPDGEEMQSETTGRHRLTAVRTGTREDRK